MRKVVINTCHGGFGLSDAAKELYLQKKGIEFERGKVKFGQQSFNKVGDEDWSFYDEVDNIDRHDPVLVQVVEELGDKASGMCAQLCVVEVTGRYYIEEYDGMESVEEEDSFSRGWV